MRWFIMPPAGSGADVGESAVSCFPALLCCQCFCPLLSLAYYQIVSSPFLCSLSLLPIFTFTWAAVCCWRNITLLWRLWPQQIWVLQTQVVPSALFLIPLDKARTEGGNNNREERLYRVDSGQSTCSLGWVELCPRPQNRYARDLTPGASQGECLQK